MTIDDGFFYAIFLAMTAVYFLWLFSGKFPSTQTIAARLNVFAIWLCACALAFAKVDGHWLSFFLAQLAFQNMFVARKM